MELIYGAYLWSLTVDTDVNDPNSVILLLLDGANLEHLKGYEFVETLDMKKAPDLTGRLETVEKRIEVPTAGVEEHRLRYLNHLNKSSIAESLIENNILRNFLFRRGSLLEQTRHYDNWGDIVTPFAAHAKTVQFLQKVFANQVIEMNLSKESFAMLSELMRLYHESPREDFLEKLCSDKLPVSSQDSQAQMTNLKKIIQQDKTNQQLLEKSIRNQDRLSGDVISFGAALGLMSGSVMGGLAGVVVYFLAVTGVIVVPLNVVFLCLFGGAVAGVIIGGLIGYANSKIHKSKYVAEIADAIHEISESQRELGKAVRNLSLYETAKDRQPSSDHVTRESLESDREYKDIRQAEETPTTPTSKGIFFDKKSASTSNNVGASEFEQEAGDQPGQGK